MNAAVDQRTKQVNVTAVCASVRVLFPSEEAHLVPGFRQLYSRLG